MPVMEAVGWILTGAAICSLAVVATAWALMRLTNIDESSSASLAGTNAVHDVMRAEQGDRRVEVSARDANASSYGM
jgi:HD superfamily phosphohydrolase YqeK